MSGETALEDLALLIESVNKQVNKAYGLQALRSDSYY